MSILFYSTYKAEIQTLDETLFSQMRICSYDLKCEKFCIDFVEKEEQQPSILYKNDNGLESFYPIPNSQNYLLHFHLPQGEYKQQIASLQKATLWKFGLVLVILFFLSVLFSLYALYPLRHALMLTQEFIKDILHDFNTPLASLRLNSAMLQREIGTNEKLLRIEQSVANILALQEHLRSYLQNHILQKESFELKALLQETLSVVEKNYSDIHFIVDVRSQVICTNKEAFSRIIQNILTNATKYNKPYGEVKILLSEHTLHIIDTGKGIKNPKKIFDRFYKEQERGIGIGLHIVKKLCDELDIAIKVQSVLGEGTTFSLDLRQLIRN
ncbi:MAG: sensor histidine kinase [Sulfurimonadaceae bacterium]